MIYMIIEAWPAILLIIIGYTIFYTALLYFCMTVYNAIAAHFGWRQIDLWWSILILAILAIVVISL